MNDLVEFVGDDALRASILKKRDKAEAKRLALIAKAQEKLMPIEAEISKYDDMLAVLDKHAQAKSPAPAPEPAPVPEPEKTNETSWKDDDSKGDLAENNNETDQRPVLSAE